MKTTLLPCLLISLMTLSPASLFGAKPEKIEDLYNPELKPFYHGVASGDPLPDGVILWTRVTRDNPSNTADIRVQWTVATDKALNSVVMSGETLAEEGHDFTVKVDVHGLNAGSTFYYGFKALGVNSPVGRTKTAPSVAVNKLKFAVVSCADYEWGYFSGYRAISRRYDLDAVIHLGDYIYEYADNDTYSSPEIREKRVVFPSHETVTLNDYRLRYSTYHLDPNLQRAHKVHPFIAIWDDHEFADNAWKGGAENHQKDTEGSWQARKAAAKRAYFEWMPIRGNGDSIYRTLHYGPLMDLTMLDTRVEGRDKQLDDVNDPRLRDPDRTIMGYPQKNYLKTTLQNSQATWNVVGNQVVFSEFNIGFAAPVDPDGAESLFLDSWDGYPKERRELVKFMANKNISNTVLLTGDVHSSFAFEVADPAFGNPAYNPKTGAGAVAVEFVTPSLSAGNFDEEVGDFFSSNLESKINTPDSDGVNPNPHMKFADLDQHGYIVLSVTPAQVQADFYFLHDILKPKTTERWGGGFINPAGTHHLKKAQAAAP
ncbi:MAG: alkaline phosphatase D family protein [Luteolibacter sp.]|uniref:alkaline phosphatase D family protein n=1 Tax=Luteolibacter sp. TaxID=1962973 RepID=UPI003267C7F3